MHRPLHLAGLPEEAELRALVQQRARRPQPPQLLIRHKSVSFLEKQVQVNTRPENGNSVSESGARHCSQSPFVYILGTEAIP